jgi:hypothetical protein
MTDAVPAVPTAEMMTTPIFADGTELARLRGRAGMSLEDLATAAGYSALLVGYIESKPGPLSGAAVGRLRAILDQRIAENWLAPKAGSPAVTPHKTMSIVEAVKPKARVSHFHGPCGAKTRAGTPCKAKAVYANGRCKLHGGLSTGAKSAEGIQRIRDAQRRRRQREAEAHIK